LTIIVSMEEKLKRRKLDALKRGVHRIPGGEALPITTHVVGIGRAGLHAIAEMLRSLEPGGPKFSALAIDIGDHDMGVLRDLLATIPAERAEVTLLSLEVPDRTALLDGLERYPDFLTLEYPLYQRASYQVWLSTDGTISAHDHYDRAVAKAVYGLAYYAGSRPMQRALRAFADRVEAARAQAVIAIVFGLGGGTGSGIAVDLARHLSGRIFGRRALVTGIGIAPCDGDAPPHSGARLFPVLNELDCLGDEIKNKGIVASCGELFRNPFTAGFMLVPQQHVWEVTRDLEQTHRRVDQEIATLLTARGGLNLYETLRLLNWVAAPSTQHSAARTPWGPKWIHMLAFADTSGQPILVGPDMARSLGLLADYASEFIEMRVQEVADPEAGIVAKQVEAAFHPDVAPQAVAGGRAGSVQFVLPCIAKTDLGLFYKARDAYDAEAHDAKLLDHSLLLEQGVLLSEPSTRLEGMAGESLREGGGWTAVLLSDMRGGPGAALRPEPTRELRELGYAN
jgi:hypothetical protein